MEELDEEVSLADSWYIMFWFIMCFTLLNYVVWCIWEMLYLMYVAELNFCVETRTL